MTSLFELPSERARKRFAKAGNYDESQHPRDQDGKWTSGGGGGAGKPKKPRRELSAWERVKGTAGHLLPVGGALAAGAIGIPLVAHGVSNALAIRQFPHMYSARQRALAGIGLGRQIARQGRHMATRASAMFGGRTAGLGGSAAARDARRVADTVRASLSARSVGAQRAVDSLLRSKEVPTFIQSAIRRELRRR